MKNDFVLRLFLFHLLLIQIVCSDFIAGHFPLKGLDFSLSLEDLLIFCNKCIVSLQYNIIQKITV